MSNYNPAFDIILGAVSSHNIESKERLEKYIIHRKKFGRQVASRIYPDCHNIQITDPYLKDVWKTLLHTVDKL